MAHVDGGKRFFPELVLKAGEISKAGDNAVNGSLKENIMAHAEGGKIYKRKLKKLLKS